MSMYESSTWINDLDEEIQASPRIDLLNDKSIMITGAAGLVCSAFVDLLIRHNEAHGGTVSILLAGRWLEEMTSRFGSYMERPYIRFVTYDAAQAGANELPDCDYIVHGASNAFPSMIMKEPAETLLSNVSGIHEILRHAVSSKPTRVLYVSSSEVYGQKLAAGPCKEGEYGAVDILNPRSSYSMGKRAAETLCASYVSEYDANVVMVRPGHIYGPTASPNDNRVGSAWSYAAARNENIVMKSDGKQLRSYCYCLDCATAMLAVLLAGERGHAYNISNSTSVISIADVAGVLSRVGGVGLLRENASSDEQKGFNPMLDSSLDATSLESLGWQGLFDADRGFRHTVDILRDRLATE